jgi:hypothetical protein
MQGMERLEINEAPPMTRTLVGVCCLVDSRSVKDIKAQFQAMVKIVDFWKAIHPVILRTYCEPVPFLVLMVDKVEIPRNLLKLGDVPFDCYTPTEALVDDVDLLQESPSASWELQGLEESARDWMKVPILESEIISVYKVLGRRCTAKVKREERQCNNQWWKKHPMSHRCRAHQDLNKFVEWNDWVSEQDSYQG